MTVVITRARSLIATAICSKPLILVLAQLGLAVFFWTKIMLTQEELKKFLDYDMETGIFTWKIKRKRVNAGDIAGTCKLNGYLQIMINYKFYLCHRLAWLYIYGEFPNGILDHIDGNRANNKIFNLRQATSRQNNINAKLSKRNTSGVKGVYWHTQNKKWYAQININGKNKHIGFFNDIDSAKKSVMETREKYHGEFANHG